MQYMNVYGYYNIKLKTLRQYLLDKLPAEQVPALSTISLILRNTFQLKNEPFSGSQYKYCDPTFGEKRLWVSRLLA